MHGTIYNLSAYGIIFDKAKGIFLFDEDGNKYYDLSMGSGVHLLGHSNKKIIKAIKKQASSILVSQKNNKNNIVLTKLLDSYTPNHLSNYVFSNSGSEAIQRAVRLARATTGKMEIASLYTGWHGVSDITLYKGTGVDSTYKISIPSIQRAMEFIYKYKDRLAAFIVEPIQQTNPLCEIHLLKEIEILCNKFGIILIFDEIITGFRCSIKGIASIIEAKPDIIVYGKSVGGGLPIGITAFTNKIANSTFLDKSKDIQSGGTFSLNHLTSSAAIATLKQLELSDYSKLNNLGVYFRNILLSQGIECVGTGSISRILGVKDQSRFTKILFSNKVLYPTNGLLFTSFKHSHDDIGTIANKIIKAYKQLNE
jgi:glutamate-1-semialdehyde 2,1-aminomutase